MLNQDYKEMLSILLDEKVEFLLAGAYALAAHGFPRTTGYIDIFIWPSSINSQKVYKLLLKFGAPMGNINTNDFEKSRVIFQIGIAPRRIDIINEIDCVSFDSAFEDKIIVEIDGLKVPIISKEKMIKNKESTGRNRDILDTKMLKNS
ncbi:MAG: hypothetical protein IIA61_02615 [Candidatus Marinimicrobia bacterium]|nr:hypothetical protein [Candidatus Neomarinimicrobiota bacterium]